MPVLLSSRKKIQVRFSEVDSLHVVWHGHYARYFEDGREDFGHQHGLRYLDVYQHELLIPIVKLELDYKKPLTYGDSLVIETTFVNVPAAKLIFDYKIFNLKDESLACTGRSTQVFLNKSGELQLNVPTFFSDWKRKMGLAE